MSRSFLSTPSSPSVAILAATFSVAANSTSVADVTGLSLTVTPGSYLVSGAIAYEAGTAVDLTLNLTGPAGSSGFWSPGAPASSATSNNATTNYIRRDFGTGVVIGGAGAASFVVARPSGYLVVTQEGSLTVRAAQGVADASTVTIGAGSFIKLDKIA